MQSNIPRQELSGIQSNIPWKELSDNQVFRDRNFLKIKYSVIGTFRNAIKYSVTGTSRKQSPHKLVWTIRINIVPVLSTDYGLEFWAYTERERKGETQGYGILLQSKREHRKRKTDTWGYNQWCLCMSYLCALLFHISRHSRSYGGGIRWHYDFQFSKFLEDFWRFELFFSFKKKFVVIFFKRKIFKKKNK